MTLRLVVDSDGGIDDAAAIAWLVAQPGVTLAAVTAVGGNCGVRQAARNLRVVLEAAGAPDVPVYLGAEPTAPAPHTTRPVMIHGYDGLGDVGFADPEYGPDLDTPAVEVLVREFARGSRLLALGPMTNIAAAVQADPGAVASAGGFVFMGGSANGEGNARPAGEANVVHDPTAAAVSFAAGWSTPPVMVGLDVTHQATLRDHEFDLLGEHRTAAAAFLDGPLRFYRQRAGTFCAAGETPCHDLLAAMVAADSPGGLVATELLPVEVDTAGGPAWGTTVVDRRVLHWRRAGALPPGGLPTGEQTLAGNEAAVGSPLEVALGVDVERFRRQLSAMAGA